MMVHKLVKGAVLGGLILFVWSIFVWTVFPWHKMYMMKFKDEQKVARVIEENAPQSGLYILPNGLSAPKDSDESMDVRQRMEEGPFLFTSVRLEGKNPNLMNPIAEGFILKVVSAFLVMWLLTQTKVSYDKRVAFVTVVGLVVGLMATFPNWMWFGFPGGFVAASLFEITVGWFLAGLAMSKLIK